MKIVICLLILILSFLCARIYLSQISLNLDFLKEGLSFLDYLKININYSHLKKNELLTRYSKECKTALKNMLNNEKITQNSKKHEILMQNLINEIGTTDIDGQNLIIEKYKNILEKEERILMEELQNKNKYVYKLALLLGLLFCVLLI